MKSSSTIDLMKTSNGYSILEGQTLINKPSPTLTMNPSPIVAGNTLNQPQNIVNATGFPTGKYSKQKPISNSAAIPKKFITQQNFTIYPYIYHKEAENHKYVIIPAKTQWFNLNNVHDIEKKALPEWFKQKKGVLATMNKQNHMKFQKNEELYKKYRNHVIQLGKTQYVSPLLARKGLAGDACSIIRIQSFLQKWGLINYIYQKPRREDKPSSSPTAVNNQESSSLKNPYSSIIQQPSNFGVIPQSKRRDIFDKDKLNIIKTYDKDDLELLKKITKKFRPICKSCQSICGVSWYEYCQKMQIKIFQHSNANEDSNDSHSTIVRSGDQFQYNLRVCFACFSEKNFPVVLNFQDFTKKSIHQIINSIDFDRKYKKKAQEFAKIADAVQKNKFNISKSSDILKISQNELLDTLMQIPIQSIQKISRIEPETQDQTEKPLTNENSVHPQKHHLITQSKHGSIQDNEDLKIFKTNLEGLTQQQQKIYEQFIQSWLLKIYSKMELLQQWDKSVQWKQIQNQSIKQHNIAEKLKKNYKNQ